jgi:nucleotide-binding universal stress UspA family protein
MERDMAYRNILVAIDGSEEADRAFWKAMDVAKRYDASVTLVYVVDTRQYYGLEAYDTSYTQRIKKHGEEMLKAYVEKAKEQGIEKVDMLVEEGSPKSAISKRVAKKVNADVIICGATGLNAVERVLIGSVAEHIIRHAECDVIVVR